MSRAKIKNLRKSDMRKSKAAALARAGAFLAVLVCSPVYSAQEGTASASKDRSNGKIFYEITHETGEGAPSFLIGSQHNICLKRDSLPPEINSALDQADAVALEGTLEEKSLDKQLQAFRANTLFTEEGESLDLYIEESRANRLFDIIKDALSHDADGRLQKLLQKEIGVSIASYSTLLQLTPFGALHATLVADGFSKASDKKAFFAAFETAKASDDLVQKDHCSSLEEDGALMDIYLEKRLSCQKKPVYALETAESAFSAVLQGPGMHAHIGQTLSSYIDMHFSGPLEEAKESGRASLYRGWKSEVSAAAKRLAYAATETLHRNKPAEEAIEEAKRRLLAFFKANEPVEAPLCTIGAQKETEALTARLLKFLWQGQMAVAAGKRFKQPDWTNISRLFDEAIARQRSAFQTCFPFEAPERLLKQEAQEKALAMGSLKQLQVSVLDSRDSKMAANLAEVLDRERTVVAVTGAAHLPGVIRELKTFGYEARPVPLSYNIIEANGCYDDDDELNDKSER